LLYESYKYQQTLFSRQKKLEEIEVTKELIEEKELVEKIEEKSKEKSKEKLEELEKELDKELKEKLKKLKVKLEEKLEKKLEESKEELKEKLKNLKEKLEKELKELEKDYYFYSYDKKDGTFTVLKIPNLETKNNQNAEKNGINIIYRGINVESPVYTLFYSDITAYIWGGKASEILKINREELLSSSNDFIFKKINNAFSEFAVELKEKPYLKELLNKNLSMIQLYLLDSKKTIDVTEIPFNENSEVSIPAITLYPTSKGYSASEIMKLSFKYILANWQNISFTNYPLEKINDGIQIPGQNDVIIICENIFHELAQCYNTKIKPNELLIVKNPNDYFSLYRYGFNSFCNLLIDEERDDERKFYYQYLNDEIKNYFLDINPSYYWMNENNSNEKYLYFALPILNSWRDAYEDLLLEMSEKRKFDTITGIEFSSKYILFIVENDYGKALINKDIYKKFISNLYENHYKYCKEVYKKEVEEERKN
jgi:hypothetical protein